MRFPTTLIVPALAMLVFATGCRNTTTMRCERETALLRAEILDLEDKYYALKSHYESGGGIGTVSHGGIVGSGALIGSGAIIGSGVQGSPVVVGSAPMVVDSYPVEGDVIYDDQYISGGMPETIIPGTVLPGSIVPGTVMEGTVLQGTTMPTPAMPVEGEVYYESQSIPASQSIMGPSANSDYTPDGLGVETPAIDEATSDDEQTLMLPDSLELEVGFEDLELELSSDADIDRVEIVTDATRGKDLDGIPGHDGIELMIRTLNSDGQFIEQTGELTVTVKDQLAGEIGKWTFLPKELQLFLSRDEFGNMGTLLHLPWSDRIPVSKQVEVRVAMLIGNVEYIASQNITIDPPTGQSHGGAIVGWASDNNRWVSPRSTMRTQPNRQAPKSIFDKPSTVIQRPEWKPVR